MANHTRRNQTAEQVVMTKAERFAQRNGVPVEAVARGFWGYYIKKNYFHVQARNKRINKAGQGAFGV